MAHEIQGERRASLEGRVSRGMTKAEAIEYVGCKTAAAFDRWRRQGIVPGPIPGTRRWDRVALDRALDAAQGLTAPSNHLNPYQRWKAENASHPGQGSPSQGKAASP
jgi:hypothetical protein